jgi:putative Ca2+/H+ antiporter (TMEM165/GDT1 family)
LDFKSFAETFSLVFVAEMGDKTQLMVMALSARHAWGSVFAGAASAFAVLGVLAVLVGQVLFRVVDPLWIKLAAAALFTVLGALSLFGKGEEEGEEEEPHTRSVALGVFGLIFVAELGDKTQLATMGMAASSPSALGVFSGATLALWTVSLIGIFFGRKVVAKLPEALVRKGSGVLFIFFGILTAWSALHP